METQIPSLDHIILLLPPALLDDPPNWLTSNFTITPGGVHADGLTYNALIALPSGTYIELISFIPSTSKESHWWGDKNPGWIDWCLTSTDSKIDLPTGNNELGITYQDAKEGGRTRPDGTQLKWSVRFPATSITRGSAPFFCFDVTERSLRVPPSTAHPSGAVGVASIILICAPSRQSYWTKALEPILGGSEIPAPETRMPATQVKVLAPRDSEEEKRLRENGDAPFVGEVVLWVDGEVPGRITEVVEGCRIDVSFVTLS